MKRSLFFSMFVAVAWYGLLNCSASLQAADRLSAPFEAEEQNFYKQIEDLIEIDQKRLNSLQQRAYSRTEIPMWSNKVALEQAIVTLEVKKTLYANFKNTLSIKSPLVRQKLLSLMRQEQIVPSELAELQALTGREKQRLKDEKASVKKFPAPLPLETGK